MFMQIVCLNVWKGRMFKELSTFIHNNPADIYCSKKYSVACQNHEGMQLNLLQELQICCLTTMHTLYQPYNAMLEAIRSNLNHVH